jgi:cysteine dioxygenase
MTTLRPFIGDLQERAPLERTLSEMADLLSAACGSWSPSRPLVSRPNGYTRTRVFRDGRFEVVLLNWDPGATSAVHDHGGEHCWMSVLEGRLLVDDYVRLDAGENPGRARIEGRDSRVLECGDLDLRSGRFDLHRVSATPDAPAISLHVYAAPLRKYMVYDEASQRCQTVIGTYDDVFGDRRRLQSVG